MAATIKLFGIGASHIANAAVDWDTDTVKMMLTTSAYTPNQDTHDFRDDVTNEIANGGGYSTGGFTIANKTRTYDGATNEVRLDADDLSVSAFDPASAFRYGVFYKSRGGAAGADELIGWIDFGADIDPGGLDFLIQWGTSGVFKGVVA